MSKMVKIIKNKIVYEKNITNNEGKASVIVFPDSIDEIKNIVKLTNSDIIPRGGGTSFTGACVPDNSIIIDFSKMNKILDLNTSRHTAIVEPGVTVKELNEKLEVFGLEFPVESIFPGLETIGGLIAKNSSGSREIKYGRMINWIDYLEVINGKGEHVKVSKSDTSDFAGMEGTTGTIIKACIRLTNKKTRSISLLKSDSLSDIFKANRKLRLDQYISSIDFINKEISELLGLQKKYHLFIEFEDDRGNFKGEDYIRFLNLKNKAYSKAASEGFYLMESAKLFSENMHDVMLAIEERKLPYFSHLASGVIYCCFKPEDKEKRQGILSLIRRLKGELSYNLGYGLVNRYLDNENPSSSLLMRVKKRHDPQGKFNHSKLINLETNLVEIKKKIEENKPEEQISGEIKLEEKQEQNV